MIEIIKCRFGNSIVGVTGYKGYIGTSFLNSKNIGSEQFEKPDILIHLAAHTSNEIEIFKDNLSVDVEIINFCKKNNIKLIYASTNNVYPLGVNLKETDPVFSKDFYGLSKIAGECLIQNQTNEIEYIILRIGDVFGKNQRYGNFFKMVASCIENGNPITLYGTGSKVRSYIYIQDLVRVLDFFINNFSPLSNNIYNVCYSEALSIYNIIMRVADYAKLKIEPKEYPEQFDSRTMDNQKLIDTKFPFLFNIDQALVHYMEEIKKHD